jgi:hypothetical protein
MRMWCSVSRSWRTLPEVAGQEAGSAPDRSQHGDKVKKKIAAPAGNLTSDLQQVACVRHTHTWTMWNE